MTDNQQKEPQRIPIRFADAEPVEEDKGVGPDMDPESENGDRDSELSATIGDVDVALEDQEVIDADQLDAANAIDLNELLREFESHSFVPGSPAGAIPIRGEVLPDSDEAPSLEIPAGPMLAEFLATRAELKRIETERNETLDKLARRQADFDNYKKRVDRGRTESYNRLVGDLVQKLLPVADNLRRALDAEAAVQAGESEEFSHFLRGIELIAKQLNDVLEGLGVQSVPTVGHPFDPHVHEAVAMDYTEDFEPDTVTQELVRGYVLGDKLIRPAVVKVATR